MRSSALLMIVAAFLALVIWFGHWALSRIHDEDRYLVPFADIETDAPEGMERADFLDQVQFHGRLPERLNVLDEDLPARLKQGFARHPWVEKVDAVTVTAPRRIEVKLAFRVPALAAWWDGEMRALDGDGVFLPKNAPTAGLPIYAGEPRRPRGPPGTHWGDSDLEREARKLRDKRPVP